MVNSQLKYVNFGVDKFRNCNKLWLYSRVLFFASLLFGGSVLTLRGFPNVTSAEAIAKPVKRINNWSLVIYTNIFCYIINLD